MGKYGNWTYKFTGNDKVEATHPDGRKFIGSIKINGIIWDGEGKPPPPSTTKYIFVAYLGGKTIRKPKK